MFKIINLTLLASLIKSAILKTACYSDDFNELVLKFMPLNESFNSIY